jgi:hypothetical protein
MRRSPFVVPIFFALASLAGPGAAQGECGVAFTFTDAAKPCCTVCGKATDHVLAGSAVYLEEVALVRFELETPIPDFGAHVLVLGSGRSGLPFRGQDGICELLPSPDFLFHFVVAVPDDGPLSSVRAVQTFVVPHDPSLAGITLFAQAVHLDQAKSPVGALSNGLRIETE